MNERINKKYKEIGLEFPSSEPIGFNFDFVPIPAFHPNPNKSIELNQAIVSIVETGGRLIEKIKEKYDSFQLVDQYYFCVYCEEYFNNKYYPPYYQSYLNHQYKSPEQTSWDTKNMNYHEWKKKLNSNVEEYDQALKQGMLVLEFILLRIDFLKSQVQKLYSKHYQGNTFSLLPDNASLELSNLSSKEFRVDIGKNPDAFFNEVRRILLRINLSPHLIDAFIYNSFNFPSNTSSIELLSFNFGNSGETYRTIHSIYKSHKRVVRRPKVDRVHFAKIMFLNFNFIRNNWEKTQAKDPNDTLIAHLSRSVAKNIQSTKKA